MIRPSSPRTRVLVIFTVLAIALATLSLKTPRAFMMGIGSALVQRMADVTTSGEVRLRDRATTARASAVSNFLLDPNRQGWALLAQPLNALFRPRAVSSHRSEHLGRLSQPR